MNQRHGARVNCLRPVIPQMLQGMARIGKDGQWARVNCSRPVARGTGQLLKTRDSTAVAGNGKDWQGPARARVNCLRPVTPQHLQGMAGIDNGGRRGTGQLLKTRDSTIKRAKIVKMFQIREGP